MKYTILYFAIGIIGTVVFWIIPYCAAWYRVKRVNADTTKGSIPKLNNKITVPWVREILNTFRFSDDASNIAAMIAAVFLGPIIMPIMIIGIVPWKGGEKLAKILGRNIPILAEAIVKKFALTKEEKAQIALGTIKSKERETEERKHAECAGCNQQFTVPYNFTQSTCSRCGGQIVATSRSSFI